MVWDPSSRVRRRRLQEWWSAFRPRSDALVTGTPHFGQDSKGLFLLDVFPEGMTAVEPISSIFLTCIAGVDGSQKKDPKEGASRPGD